MIDLKKFIKETTESVYKLGRIFRRMKNSQRRWRMMAKSGKNKKERLHDQVHLKGRGKKTRNGGTTTRDRR